LLKKEKRKRRENEEKTKRKRRENGNSARKFCGKETARGRLGRRARNWGRRWGKKIFSASKEKDFNDFALFRSGKIRYTAQAASAVWGDERTRGKPKSRFRRRYY